MGEDQMHPYFNWAGERWVMHQIDITQALKLCQEIPLLQERLRRVGLHKTANKMQTAVEEIGYEVANYIEYERKERGK